MAGLTGTGDPVGDALAVQQFMAKLQQASNIVTVAAGEQKQNEMKNTAVLEGIKSHGESVKSMARDR
jgi:hypothetical protein